MALLILPKCWLWCVGAKANKHKCAIVGRQ